MRRPRLEETLWRNVYRVPAGCALEIDDQRRARPPLLGFRSRVRGSSRDGGRLRRRFPRAVRAAPWPAAMPDDERVGVFLSGGIDSSSIACLAQATRAARRPAAGARVDGDVPRPCLRRDRVCRRGRRQVAAGVDASRYSRRGTRAPGRRVRAVPRHHAAAGAHRGRAADAGPRARHHHRADRLRRRRLFQRQPAGPDVAAPQRAECLRSPAPSRRQPLSDRNARTAAAAVRGPARRRGRGFATRVRAGDATSRRDCGRGRSRRFRRASSRISTGSCAACRKCSATKVRSAPPSSRASARGIRSTIDGWRSSVWRCRPRSGWPAGRTRSSSATPCGDVLPAPIARAPGQGRVLDDLHRRARRPRRFEHCSRNCAAEQAGWVDGAAVRRPVRRDDVALQGRGRARTLD